VPSTGATGVVPVALLSNRPAAAAAPSASAAPSDPGSGGFNPFVAEAASAPEAASDDGVPWGWIAGAVTAIAAAALGFTAHKRRAGHVRRGPPGR
jgi:hypothetical protein